MVAVKVGTACRPKGGETVSGDAAGTWQSRAHTLVAVVDGLGSGPQAAEASTLALSCIAANRDQPLAELVGRCHLAIQHTRGAVLALARVDHKQGQMAFVGVGNIGFSAVSAVAMHPVCHNGLVGHRLPSLAEFSYPCSPGDLVVLYSDGISPRFQRQGGLAGLSSSNWTDPQKLAQQIVAGFGEAEDDAAVVTLMVTALQTPRGAEPRWS